MDNSNSPICCHPMECKTALHKVGGTYPYELDLNVYRGCSHGCKYCFALYSHKYLKSEQKSIQEDGADASYFNHIYAKTNIAFQLEKELSRLGRSRMRTRPPTQTQTRIQTQKSLLACKTINFGSVSDSYQPAEAEFSIMPDIWKLMIRYKNPVVISTKSDLILRDLDLIDELSKVASVHVASTITATDVSIQKKIEPGCVSTARRFEMLRKMKKTDATIGVHMMPVMPLLTDTDENLEAIFSKTKEIGADYILGAALFLRGETKKSYLEFIQNDFPQLSNRMRDLYKTGHLDKKYKTELYEKLDALTAKYDLSNNYRRVDKEGRKRDEEKRRVEGWTHTEKPMRIEKKERQSTLLQFC
ncbi:SPL family radical SAM protein [Methanolapillus ohkumae]|uniref:Radical SAM core domain-containing protein n=1 Tax=Methanolapillus ohkumae TaxID=3028298 RepID=A0AA96V7R9_9EURY|nr:hypothetical protein MsAm2_05880 [Methanosarcinaceae archaeon Am2]